MAYLSHPFLGLYKRRVLAREQAVQNYSFNSTDYLNVPLTDTLSLSVRRCDGFTPSCFQKYGTRPIHTDCITPESSPTALQSGLVPNELTDRAEPEGKNEKNKSKPYQSGNNIDLCKISVPEPFQITKLSTAIDSLKLKEDRRETAIKKWNQNSCEKNFIMKNEKELNAKKKDWWELAKNMSYFAPYIFRQRPVADNNAKVKVKPIEDKPRPKVTKKRDDMASSRQEPCVWMDFPPKLPKKSLADHIKGRPKQKKFKRRRRRRKEPPPDSRPASDESDTADMNINDNNTLNSKAINVTFEKLGTGPTTGQEQLIINKCPGKRLEKMEITGRQLYNQNLNSDNEEEEHYDYGFNPRPIKDVETNDNCCQGKAKSDSSENDLTLALATLHIPKRRKKHRKKLRRKEKGEEHGGEEKGDSALKLRIDMPGVRLYSREPTDVGNTNKDNAIDSDSNDEENNKIRKDNPANEEHDEGRGKKSKKSRKRQQHKSR